MPAAVLTIARIEADRRETRGYDELARLCFPVTYEAQATGPARRKYVELTLVERTPEYLHICVSVSDEGWRAFVPVTEDRLVHAGQSNALSVAPPLARS